MPSSDIAVEMYKSVISSVQQSINYCFLLNGGAIIGILSFLTKYQDQYSSKYMIRISIMLYAGGVLVSCLCSIFMYMAQYSYFSQSEFGRKPFVFAGTTYRIVLVVSLVVSITLFCVASVVASYSLLPDAPAPSSNIGSAK